MLYLPYLSILIICIISFVSVYNGTSDFINTPYKYIIVNATIALVGPITSFYPTIVKRCIFFLDYVDPITNKTITDDSIGMQTYQYKCPERYSNINIYYDLSTNKLVPILNSNPDKSSAIQQISAGAMGIFFSVVITILLFTCCCCGSCRRFNEQYENHEGYTI